MPPPNSDIIKPSDLDAAVRNAAASNDGYPSQCPFILTGGGVVAPMTISQDSNNPVMMTWKYTPPKAPKEDVARGITPSISISIQVFPPKPDPRKPIQTDPNATASAVYDRSLATPMMRIGWERKPSALLTSDDVFSGTELNERTVMQVPGRQLWWVQEEVKAGFLVCVSGGMSNSLALAAFMDPVWSALRRVGTNS